MQDHIDTKIKSLWKKFGNRSFREAFVSSRVGTKIAAQIQTMRESKGWTQAQLAKAAGMKQSRISVLENPDYETMNLLTLRRLARAFDVALSIKFVPFSELLSESVGDTEKGYYVTFFENDKSPNAPSPTWVARATILSTPPSSSTISITDARTAPSFVVAGVTAGVSQVVRSA